MVACCFFCETARLRSLTRYHSFVRYTISWRAHCIFGRSTKARIHQARLNHQAIVYRALYLGLCNQIVIKSFCARLLSNFISLLHAINEFWQPDRWLDKHSSLKKMPIESRSDSHARGTLTVNLNKFHGTDCFSNVLIVC